MALDHTSVDQRMIDNESTRSVWQVFALRVGQLSVPAHTLTAGADHEIVEAPVIMWVLRSANDIVLFDTGTPSVADVAQQRPGLHYSRRSDEEPREALRSIGVEPEDVTVIINSHLHWDHSSNNHHFPRAGIIVQATEWLAANEPPPGHQAAYTGVSNAAPPWLQAKGRTEQVNGDVEVLPGLKIMHLPGHTPGSQGVRVATQHREICLAGDLVPLASHLQTTPSTLPGVMTSRAQAKASLQRLAGLDARVLGSHDATIFERGGSVVRVDHTPTPNLT